ncbi:MAG: carbohydrate ABC transporter permease [Clostridiales bacterium]|nr:carbohydrate ABC transporter permease [Clostridiales bacterium]
MATVEHVSKKKIRRRKKMTKGDRLFAIFAWTFFIFFSIVSVYPVLHIVAASFSGAYDLFYSGKAFLIPKRPTIQSYVEILFHRSNIRQAALITIGRTALGTAAGLLANAFLAYILSRKKFLFKSGLSLFWIFTMYATAGWVPMVILFKRLRLLSSFWVYILPGLISAFHVLVIKTYMGNIPDSLEESAQLEGAGHLKIFWSIVSPICKPVYATIAFFIAVQHWNSWFDALLYNRMCYKLSTLQYELVKYMTATVSAPTSTNIHSPTDPEVNGITPQSISAVVCVLTILPVIILYPFLQKYFANGLRIRGIKD